MSKEKINRAINRMTDVEKSKMLTDSVDFLSNATTDQFSKFAIKAFNTIVTIQSKDLEEEFIAARNLIKNSRTEYLDTMTLKEIFMNAIFVLSKMLFQLTPDNSPKEYLKYRVIMSEALETFNIEFLEKSSKRSLEASDLIEKEKENIKNYT